MLQRIRTPTLITRVISSVGNQLCLSHRSDKLIDAFLRGRTHRSREEPQDPNEGFIDRLLNDSNDQLLSGLASSNLHRIIFGPSRIRLVKVSESCQRVIACHEAVAQ